MGSRGETASQDTAGEVALAEAEQRARGRRLVAVVGVLGVNVWVAFGGLPAMHLGRTGDLAFHTAVLVVVALLPLGAGLVVLDRSRRASGMLLGLAFPLCLLLPAGGQPSMVGPSVFGAGATAYAAVSLAAYLLAGSWARARGEAEPLTSRTTDLEEVRRPRLAFLMRAFPFAAAAVAVVVVGSAVVHGRPDPTVRAGPGPVVVAAWAFALWVVAILAVLAPAAARPRLRRLPKPSLGAAFVWLLVLALALAMLLVSEG